MKDEELQRIIEALIFASEEPMSISRMQSVFSDDAKPDKKSMKNAIAAIQENYKGRGIELKEVGSGYRFQVPQICRDCYRYLL